MAILVPYVYSYTPCGSVTVISANILFARCDITNFASWLVIGEFTDLFLAVPFGSVTSLILPLDGKAPKHNDVGKRRWYDWCFAILTVIWRVTDKEIYQLFVSPLFISWSWGCVFGFFSSKFTSLSWGTQFDFFLGHVNSKAVTLWDFKVRSSQI